MMAVTTICLLLIKVLALIMVQRYDIFILRYATIV